MVRNLLYCLLFIVLSVLCGCSEKEQPDLISICDESIEYFDSVMEFPSSGGSKTVKFSTNKNWEIHVTDLEDMDENWCEVSPRFGAAGDVTFTISVSENTSYEERSALVSILVGDVTKKLRVLQAPKEILSLSTPSTYTVTYKEQNLEIKLLTNTKFDISCDLEWIDLNSTRGINESSILLSIHENNTSENRVGTITISSESSEKVIEIFQYGLPIDLSAKGTANCYIVPLRDAYFCFDASVAGNDKTYPLHGGAGVKIVWDSSINNLQDYSIDNIEYDSEKERIIFHSKQSEGNVLIALQDQNNNIIWSWHLWLTNNNPNDNFITFSDGTILMDRYLGASTDESVGLYYQWGRKDPFCPRKYEYFRPSGNPVTVEYCNSHPNKFVGGGYDWTEWDWNTEHTAKWTTIKSIYDPCPPGWKVMDAECLLSLSEGCFIDENSRCFIIGEPNCTPQTKFKATGLIHSAGHIDGTGSHVAMWTNRGIFYNFYVGLELYLSISPNTTRFEDSYSGRIYGQCVRCQRE